MSAADGSDKFVLAFNCTNAKLKDKRVRQAIRYAINHKEIIASRGNVDYALGGPIPSVDPGYEDLTGLYPYNVDKAKELMKEAGYTTDKPLRLTLTYANTYGTELGDQLKSQLAKIGIDLKINYVEFSTWLQNVHANGDYELSLVDHAESHDFYKWTTPDYYYHYDGKQAQELYAKALEATDEADSAKYLKQAAKAVSEDAPADWLFGYRVTVAYNTHVSRDSPTSSARRYCRYGRSPRQNDTRRNDMRFVARRLLLFVAALTGLSILVFLALRVLPGDVAAVMAGTNATAARIAALRMEMGLDRPLAHAICGLADRPAAWRSGRIRHQRQIGRLAGRRARLRSRSRLSYSALPIALLDRIAAWLRGRYHQKQKMAWTAPCDRHYRRCRSRIMERPAADSAVLARLGIAGACSPHRASRTTAGRAQGVHWRRWCSPRWPPASPPGPESCAIRVPH